MVTVPFEDGQALSGTLEGNHMFFRSGKKLFIPDFGNRSWNKSFVLGL